MDKKTKKAAEQLLALIEKEKKHDKTALTEKEKKLKEKLSMDLISFFLKA